MRRSAGPCERGTGASDFIARAWQGRGGVAPSPHAFIVRDNPVVAERVLDAVEATFGNLAL